MEEKPKIPLSEEFAFKLHLTEHIFSTIWLALRLGAYVAISYIGYLAIKELAGQTTVAHFLLAFFTSEEGGKDTLIWIASTVLATGWAVGERKLRHYKVSQLSKRIHELESRFDPGRSSSGLMSSGETHPRDRLP